MRKLFRKPIFWACAAAAACVCLVLTWCVTQILADRETPALRAQAYTEAIGRALETENAQPYVFSTCTLDGGLVAAAFASNGDSRRSDLGAALFCSTGDGAELLELAFCPDGAAQNGGTQIFRLTAPDGTAYDAVISVSQAMKCLVRWEENGAGTEYEVENVPYFALFPCAERDALVDYGFYAGDGRLISASTNDMRQVAPATYVLSRCLYTRWGKNDQTGNLLILGESSLTLLSGRSNSVLDSVGGVRWCGQRLTDDQWAAMFTGPDAVPEISLAPYADRLTADAGNYRLFTMDTRLWLAFLDENGQIDRLYELTRQAG